MLEKSGLSVSKKCRKGSYNSFYLKLMFFNNPKSDQIFGIILEGNLLPRTFKIAQSGHTESVGKVCRKTRMMIFFTKLPSPDVIVCSELSDPCP